jgi:tRNA-splicing ligase RtcB
MRPPFIKGVHDANTIAQIESVAQSAEATALCADGHLGYHMPIGGVAAYRNKVSIAGVGYDIACGNAAIKTDLYWDQYGAHDGTRRVADEIFASISFGVGRKNNAKDAPDDHPLFGRPEWSIMPKHEGDRLKAKAREQLGTIGSGNHYVDVFYGSDGHIWVGVHFGSRGLGHTIASNFLALAAGLKWGGRAPDSEVGLVDLDSQIGKDYEALMNLAGEYAYAGREWVARKVVGILGGEELDLVHNHHNFAWRETHEIGGEFGEYVVVRKGATPAFPSQRGFVGGSMAGISVILSGATPTPEAQALLYSTVHGAGRIMSRTQAAGKVDRKTGEVKFPGRVTADMLEQAVREAGVTLRGGGVDESPHVYRDLRDVLQEHSSTIIVETILRPVIVCMAGANEFDPYKD